MWRNPPGNLFGLLSRKNAVCLFKHEPLVSEAMWAQTSELLSCLCKGSAPLGVGVCHLYSTRAWERTWKKEEEECVRFWHPLAECPDACSPNMKAVCRTAFFPVDAPGGFLLRPFRLTARHPTRRFVMTDERHVALTEFSVPSPSAGGPCTCYLALLNPPLATAIPSHRNRQCAIEKHATSQGGGNSQRCSTSHRTW